MGFVDSPDVVLVVVVAVVVTWFQYSTEGQVVVV